MTHPFSAVYCRRWLSGVLAVLIGLGPLATPTYAAITLLADEPLNVQNKAQPNIMLTVDDSTSMLFDFLPDSVIGTYCRDITGKMGAACGLSDQNKDFTATNRGKYVTPGYIFEQYGMPFGATNPAYDASGPGAGCLLSPAGNVTCSGGVPPGALPGLEVYPNPAGPPPAKSPKAGQPYEYWTLWPAPVHNGAFNHAYYDPRLTYVPPVHADGTDYPQITAANPSGWTWTHAPADPWAASVQYVDLTAPVTVGLWCNSDWSIGHENDPSYCRTNGTGANALSASASSTDGDYNYPWAPPGINPGNGPTIALSIAWSKVNVKTHAILAAWATAQDAKYFYENDNVLWCDPTNPLWPHQGAPSQPQTCVMDRPQTCNATNQTCSDGTPQTCTITPPTCQLGTTQTCNPAIPPVCNGAASQTCAGVGNQTCVATSQSCNLVAVCNPPDPSACTTNWDPPGCNLCTSECGSCTLTTTCPASTCSNDGSSCQTAADCPGTCSVTGSTCRGAGACPPSHVCSLDGQACNVNGDCATHPGQCTSDHQPCFDNSVCLPTRGTCSGNGNPCDDSSQCPLIPAACSIDNQACNASGDCNPTGACSNSPTVCLTAADCPNNTGQCSTTLLPCNGSCPPVGQTCSGTGLACSSTSPCPPQGGTCSGDSSLACQQASDCTQGHCSIDNSGCTSVCPDMPGPSVSATCSDLMAGALVPNGNFETPIISGIQYGPVVDASWSFFSSSGIQHYGSAFGANPSGNGQQTAFIQNLGSMSQTIALSAGSYRISFLAARRSGQIQPVRVMVDGTQIGLVSPLDANFATSTIPFAVATTGPHTIAFAGTDNSGDNTTFIDAVQISLAASLLEDANGAGVVCRHNNRAGGYSSGPYDYPNARFNTPVTAGTDANACVASPRYATVPRHYWKTSVEWCNLAVSGAVAATPKWLGYGDRSMGICQDDQDVPNNFIYPRFYQFGQPAVIDNVAIPAFQRLDLDPLVNPTFDHGLDPFGDPIHRTFGGATPDVSEMTNYANWYAYYRTRITAVKTVTSLAFKEIDGKYRVGFHTLVDGLSNVPPQDIPPVFLNVAQFDDASAAHQKPTWYSKLFGVTIPLGNETPSLQAVARIGEYYKTGSHPRLTGAVDPIILSCSKNFHLFFTDGYTNEAAVPTDVVPGDQDNKVPSYPYYATAPISGLTPGAAWPHPFQEDVASELTQNALSDYAMYYWVTDLQHSGPAAHNVLATDTDPATWQHQNFAAISLGTTGKLPTAQQSVTEAALAAGLPWPVPSPSVFHPDNSGVDDLWHAAINGRGQFVNAQSVDEVKLGIGQVLADITSQAGARAGAGLQSTSVGASSNFIYRARFEPGWAGSLTKEQIDPHTGLKVAEVWKAATQLAAQLAVGAPPNDKPWFTNRKIVTMNETGTAVPFLWENLGNEQRDSLFPPNTSSKVAREKAIVEFLRGNAANEGTKLGQFRKRKAFLGDIVDTSPVFVGVQPNAAYRDGDDPGYSTFKSTTTRPAQVYVSANDGMLHAFDDGNGNETWAYVPSPLYRDGDGTLAGQAAVALACQASFSAVPCGTAGGDPKTGLGALTYQTGALPPFKHHYMVDGPLKVADVDFGGEHWHTILVGGMGKGGNRYFALDVTNPALIINEATAASKVLWEFSDPQMGFTYGKPMIAKTKAFGGTWLVIVASGYNNPDGHGYLYFIRASDGHLMKTMTTSSLDSGSSTTPSGLAHPAGYTQDFRNQLAEQIYAGDLLGDFWRFDISDADDSHWTVGKMARLLDPSDHPQPVTTPPQIEVDVTNGIDRWVFVGTGKLYDDSDITDLQQQTMYALRDGTQTAPLAFPGPFPLTWHDLQVLPHTVGTQFGLASKPDKGWYDNLPTGATLGQRIVVPPQAALTVVAYVGTSPQNDPCLTGQTANIYARNFSNGASLLQDGGGTTLESMASAEGAVGLEIVGFDTAPGASQPDIRLAITLGTTGEVRFVNVTLPPNPVGHRMSWRLLGQ